MQEGLVSSTLLTLLLSEAGVCANSGFSDQSAWTQGPLSFQAPVALERFGNGRRGTNGEGRPYEFSPQQG
jgi:hypothetical protein